MSLEPRPANPRDFPRLAGDSAAASSKGVLTGPDGRRGRLAQLSELDGHSPQVYVFRLHQLHYLFDEAYVICRADRGEGEVVRALTVTDNRVDPAQKHTVKSVTSLAILYCATTCHTCHSRCPGLVQAEALAGDRNKTCNITLLATCHT